MKMPNLLFISPHSKTIGESYVLPNLAKNDESCDIKIFLFNVAGEWDSLRATSANRILENPARGLLRVVPDIEHISPWWNYRVWLSFVTVCIVVGLPLALIRDTRSFNVVARMATTGVAISSLFCSAKRHKFFVSMAGVPRPSPLRTITWPFLYSRYSKIVVPCETMINRVKKICKVNESKVYVIPNAVLDAGVDHEKVSFVPSKKKGHLRILFVGRLTRQKGLDWLIRSLQKIHYPSWELKIAGDGEEYENINNLVKSYSLQDRVKFLGRIEEPFLNINEIDVFVMPSRWEGPGHTVIEALARGIPTIVSDCEFGPEESVKFGEYGGVAKVDDCADLIKNLVELENNYELALSAAIKGKSDSYRYQPKSVLQNWEKLLRLG